MGILEWIASKSNEFVYFAIFLGSSSLLLNIFQICTIIRHPEFHNAFYAFFIFRGIADFLHILVSCIYYRFPTVFGQFLFPLYLQLPKWFLSLLGVVGYSSYQANNLATSFLLLNRLSAIIMPIQYPKLWPKLLPFSFAICLIFPITTSYFLINSKMTFISTKIDGNTNRTISFIVAEMQGGTYYQQMRNYISIFSIIFLIFCFCISIGTFLLYKFKNDFAANDQQNSMEIQRKLLAYALITLLGHFLNASLMVLFSIYNNSEFVGSVIQALFPQYPWLMDFCTIFLSTWTLLWASQTFRSKFLEDILPKAIQATHQSSTPVLLIQANNSPINLSAKFIQRRSMAP